MGKYIKGDKIDDEIKKDFPDPAVRDTVMAAASQLAPSGRRGFDNLTFYKKDEPEMMLNPLTKDSRATLRKVMNRPDKISRNGLFLGVVRAIDLDAMRFIIRRVAGLGSIRCVYQANHKQMMSQVLNATVSVEGFYETLPGKDVPRLMHVSAVEVVKEPDYQEDLSF